MAHPGSIGVRAGAGAGAAAAAARVTFGWGENDERLIAAGVALGLIGTIGVTRAIHKMLVVVDTSDPLLRSRLAEQVGATFASPDRARGDADLVIHASGTAEGLTLSLQLAGFEVNETQEFHQLHTP